VLVYAGDTEMSTGSDYCGSMLGSTSGRYQQKPSAMMPLITWQAEYESDIPMEEIDLLPETLRSQSLSDREIVLPYEEMLQAMQILIAANWIFLGWEAWLKLPSGIHLHPLYMGFDTPEREPGETWIAYVHRSALLCKKSMEQEQQQRQREPREKHAELYFCLTPTDH
jgi:hypothetical protein